MSYKTAHRCAGLGNLDANSIVRGENSFAAVCFIQQPYAQKLPFILHSQQIPALLLQLSTSRGRKSILKSKHTQNPGSSADGRAGH